MTERERRALHEAVRQVRKVVTPPPPPPQAERERAERGGKEDGERERGGKNATA